MNTYHFTLPMKEEDLLQLRAGDKVYLTGHMYTARDAAHKRICAALDAGAPVPFDLKGESIYYVGPAPARPGKVIGPCGPTTSYRMDAYTVQLLQEGLKVTIGKGKRAQEVKDGLRQYKGVYLAAIGGAAALLASRVTACELIAYEDLGTEAIRRLEVEEFPVTVIYDCYGGDLYSRIEKSQSDVSDPE